MVIAALNTSRLVELVRFIETCMEEIRPFGSMTLEEFLSDRKNPPYVESYLRRALEAMFDTGRHILAKTQGFRESEYKAIARALGTSGVVTEDLSLVLVKMAGYRNRMVHFYREISAEELHSIAVNDLEDIREFTRQISAFIESAGAVQGQNNP